MIEKRSNPLDEKKVEMKLNVSPKEEKEETVKPLTKRVNPLTLEVATTKAPTSTKKPVSTKPATAKAEATEKKVEAKVVEASKTVIPTSITGKIKKSFNIAMVSKTLLKALQNSTGKKTGQILDDAMLSYYAVNFPKEYKELKNVLLEEGGEIK